MSSQFTETSRYASNQIDIAFRDDVSLDDLEEHTMSLRIDGDQHVTLGSSTEEFSRVTVIDLSNIEATRKRSLLNDFKILQDLNVHHFLKHKELYFDKANNTLYITYEKILDTPFESYINNKAREHGNIPEQDILIVLVQLLTMARYLSSLKLSNPEWVRYIFMPAHIYVSTMGILTFDYAACFEKALAKTINEDAYECLAPEFLVEPWGSSLRTYNLDITGTQSSEGLYDSDRSTPQEQSIICAYNNIIDTYNVQEGGSLLRGWERLQSFDERSLVWSIGYLVLRLCIYNRHEARHNQIPQASQDAVSMNSQLKVDGMMTDESIPSLVAIGLMEKVEDGILTQMTVEDDCNRDAVTAFLQRRIEDGKRHNYLTETRYIELDNSVPQEVCAIFEQYELHHVYSPTLIDFIGRALKANVEVRPLVSTLISEEVFFNALSDIAQFLEYRDSHGNTPLHFACAFGCDSFIYDKRNVLVYTKMGNDNMQSGSMIAAYMGHARCLKEVIKYEYNCRDSYGRTALMLAASQGHAECVHHCIMEAKQVDNNNKTAMIYAADNGHWEVVEILAPFESGRRPDDGEPAICVVTRKGYARCLRCLLDTEQEFLPEVLRIVTSHPAALGLKELSDEAVVKSASDNIVKNTNSPYYDESFLKPEHCSFIEFSPRDTDDERAKKIRGLFLIIKTHCRKVKLMHQWETEEEFVQKILDGRNIKYSAANSGQNLSEISSMYISFQEQ
ncbi:Protein 21.1 [Giardia lamblia P15]|uniref:Protein 21.1 n=1 Tax=Giardia intestinalis (strain P15) TaxID=658858 RepID=E1F071_GIAIA|nr:Protein 21.1 [Giardia lamblia P15]